MSDVNMPLGEPELQRIGDYVRGHLHRWLSDVAPQAIVGPQLLERTVRVEEELKNLRETVEIRFQGVDQRFEAVDQRFEAQQAVMKAGFDAMDKRLDAQQASMKVQQWIVIVGFVILGTMVSVLGLAG